MKLLLVLICLFPQVSSSACKKEDNGSLWVEQYECEDGKKISKGHELFTESVVVEEKGKIKQQYLYQNDKINPEYLKVHSQID